MNQILVTKKLYITPELKRKKKIYKFDFIISVFLVCILTSLYIYAEYDRNKSEAVSQDILDEMNQTIADSSVDTTIANDNVLMVVLDGTEEDYNSADSKVKVDITQVNSQAQTETTPSGYKYKKIAVINIPKINVNYAVLQGETGSTEETETLLKTNILAKKNPPHIIILFYYMREI